MARQHKYKIEKGIPAPPGQNWGTSSIRTVHKGAGDVAIAIFVLVGGSANC